MNMRILKGCVIQRLIRKHVFLVGARLPHGGDGEGGEAEAREGGEAEVRAALHAHEEEEVQDAAEMTFSRRTCCTS